MESGLLGETVQAETWEELRMIAKDNEYFTEASNTLCDLYADINVRERCRDREDYELQQKYMHDRIKQQDIELRQKDAIIEQLKRELEKRHE